MSYNDSDKPRRNDGGRPSHGNGASQKGGSYRRGRPYSGKGDRSYGKNDRGGSGQRRDNGGWHGKGEAGGYRGGNDRGQSRRGDRYQGGKDDWRGRGGAGGRQGDSERGGGYRGKGGSDGYRERGGSRGFKGNGGPRKDDRGSFRDRDRSSAARDGYRDCGQAGRFEAEDGRFDARQDGDSARQRLHVQRGSGSKHDARPEQRHGDVALLERLVERASGESFGAYKGLQGTYAFDGYELAINTVQADPFAVPSQLSVTVDAETAGFPENLWDAPCKKVALEDRILREFNAAIAANAFHFADFIKGGAFSTSRPGQEVLERSACSVSEKGVTLRFEASFPARNRTIAGYEFRDMFFTALPRIVRQALLYVSYDEADLQAVADLAEDQHAIRVELARRDLVCFVANGAILPRQSGASDRPMENAVPFASPESLQVTLDLPHAGQVPGMGIPRGITLVVGGGYHGKSTLLKAIERGVYNHVSGDGREFVICAQDAVKLRAEDGRSVRGTDISLFIRNLPNQADTTAFWTEDASGSTSQAASTAEALEAKASVFLIDEDTCATNFMVRDELMAEIVDDQHEPITPFVQRMRDLYEKAGVSTVLVAGSSSAFFPIADTVVQMDAYVPCDITQKVRAACAAHGLEAPACSAPFALPGSDRLLSPAQRPLVKHAAADLGKEQDRAFAHKGSGAERLKAKVFSGVDIRVGDVGSDMRFVEQLVDSEQTSTLAAIVKTCLESDAFSREPVRALVERVYRELQESGFEAVCGGRSNRCGYAMPRKAEVYACINRLRHRAK